MTTIHANTHFPEAPERSGLARLEELGFKKVRVVHVLGTNDMVIRVLANGMPVHKTQKVPVNASIVLEVSDGRLQISATR